MSTSSDQADEGRPLDYVMVEFAPGRSTFEGDVAAELRRLSDEGLVRVLDLVVIQRAFNGSIEGFEVQDVGTEEVPGLDVDLVGLLSDEDVRCLGAAMQPGTVAGVVVWENLWSEPLVASARDAGGSVIAWGRISAPGFASTPDPLEGR